MNDNPKIFDDFRAYDLIPEEKRALIEQQLIEHCLNLDTELNGYKHATSLFDQITASTRFMQANNSAISRARYTEDTLEVAVRQEVKQYVILGAAMDTFAFRRSDLVEHLEVFEVDHPATQNLNFFALLSWDGNIQRNYTSFL